MIVQTGAFSAWHEALRDQRARIAIARRIRRMSIGNFGDVKPVGEGVSEMRVDVGAGYRVYFTVRERTVVFLLPVCLVFFVSPLKIEVHLNYIRRHAVPHVERIPFPLQRLLEVSNRL